jgi:4-amino-4-deoxy-L-arabinose transferase-like glycosyltransferase
LKSTRRESWRFLFQAVLIVLLALALRTTSLAKNPLFIDEALHINRAHSALEGDIFAGLSVNKWLYPFVLGVVFRPAGPEGPWLARALSALFGTVTVSVGIALGRALFRRIGDAASRRIGLLTGLIYAVLPMAVFHERQALVDPMMVAFTGLSILLAVRQARQPRLWVAVLLGLVLATAFLTKLLAIPYLGLPFVASVLLPRDRKTMGKSLALSALSIVIALALILPTYYLADTSGLRIAQNVQPSLDNTLLGSFLSPETQLTVRSHLRDVWGAFGYLGVGVVTLIVLSILWLALGESPREIGFLLVPGIGFMALPILAEQVTATGRLPSRYLLANTLPLTLLAVRSLQILLARLGSGLPRASVSLIGVLFFSVILGQSLYVDAGLTGDLRGAPLAARDRREYLSEQSHSTREIALVLREAWETGGQRVNALGPGTALIYLQADLGPRVGTFANSFLDRSERDVHRRALFASWLAADEQVYLFDRDDRIPALRNLDGAQTSLVGKYGLWTLLHVEGAENPLAREVYDRLAGDPAFMSADQDALAAALTRSPAQSVIVFPASHAPGLAARTSLDVIPFDTGYWPLTAPTVEAALADLGLGTASEPIDVVLVNEADTDPQRTLGLALRRVLYPTGDEEWFGLLHRQRFVTGPASPTLAPINAQYEDAIDLTQGAILDQTPQPGSAVRIALTWRSSLAIEDSFVVFVHVIDSSGVLWAQHDSEPGGGLLPMPSWEPGESIDDRFAIQLPPDIPPGEYELRIGLYHPANGLRLRVTGGQEVAPDYVVFGRISVVE